MQPCTMHTYLCQGRSQGGGQCGRRSAHIVSDLWLTVHILHLNVPNLLLNVHNLLLNVPIYC